MYFTYIIRCKDNSLYTGYTSNIIRRMEEHKTGINSKYTRAKGFDKLEVYFSSESRSYAMKLECLIKKLSKKKKLLIIEEPNKFLKELENGSHYLVGSEIT